MNKVKDFSHRFHPQPQVRQPETTRVTKSAWQQDVDKQLWEFDQRLRGIEDVLNEMVGLLDGANMYLSYLAKQASGQGK